MQQKPLRAMTRSYYPDMTITVADYLDDGDIVRECRITVGEQSVVISSRYLEPYEGAEGLALELATICSAIEKLQMKGLPTLRKEAVS